MTAKAANKPEGAGTSFTSVAVHTEAAPMVIAFRLEGFPVATQVRPLRTSPAEDVAALSPLPVMNGAFTATLAGETVTSFVGNG
jgi:hypothetical protein